MDSTVKNLLTLIKCALTDSVGILTDDINWDELYALASSHRITTLVYYGIKACKVMPPDSVLAKFEKSIYKSTMLSATNDYEISRVIKAFEENGIYHAPLKGLVVRDFYPRPEMRFVADADMIIDEAQIDKISEILKELGFKSDHESSHEYVWTKGVGVNIELHKHFLGKRYRKYYDYYENNRRKLLKPCSTLGLYEMSIDDLFVFLIVHIAKHYRSGGIGLRHFIDIYVILNSSIALNEEYVKCELEKLGLDRFYANIRKMLSAWFYDGDYDDATRLMTARIFASGVFGKKKNRAIAVSADFSSSKKLFRSLFPDYISMKQKYPILVKIPILLPIFWFVRIFDIIFLERGRIDAYMKRKKLINRENVSAHKTELEIVGIE